MGSIKYASLTDEQLIKKRSAYKTIFKILLATLIVMFLFISTHTNLVCIKMAKTDIYTQKEKDCELDKRKLSVSNDSNSA
jgi:hypothetical protein